MKKIILFLIVTILCMSITHIGLAATEDYIPEPGVVIGGELPELTSFPTAGHLWTYWQNTWKDETQSPYPEYITGVWSTDGGMENLTFGITNDEKGEAGKQEILNLVENDQTVSFEYQSYSFGELWAIQQELTGFLGDETGAYGIGIYEMENRVHIDIKADNPNSEAFMKKCFETYGNRIVFEKGDGIFLTAAENSANDHKKIWLCALILIFFLGAAALFLFRRKFAFAGQNTAAPAKNSSADICKAVKESKKVPDEALLKKILSDVEKTNK